MNTINFHKMTVAICQWAKLVGYIYISSAIPNNISCGLVELFMHRNMYARMLVMHRHRAVDACARWSSKYLRLHGVEPSLRSTTYLHPFDKVFLISMMWVNNDMYVSCTHCTLVDDGAKIYNIHSYYYFHTRDTRTNR